MLNKNILIKSNLTAEDLKKYLKSNSRSVLATSKDVYSLFKDKVDSFVNISKSELYFISDYSLKDALELSRHIMVNRYNTLISIGGGTVSDVSKLAAKYGNINLISFPTIISNDGVCSNTSVLKIDDIHTDGFASKSPDTTLVDLDIIKNSPSRFIKAGICDILSNYSAVFDWDLAIKNNKEDKNDLARIMSSNAFWSLFNLPNNVEDDLKNRIVCESIIMSGLAMEIKGNTRPCSGAEHLFNHAIMAIHPEIRVLHGYLVGLGSLVTSILQKQNFDKLVSFLKRNEIDVRPSSLGISRDIFIECWKKAKDTRPNRYTILNEVNLTDELLTDIYDKIEKEAY